MVVSHEHWRLRALPHGGVFGSLSAQPETQESISANTKVSDAVKLNGHARQLQTKFMSWFILSGSYRKLQLSALWPISSLQWGGR